MLMGKDVKREHYEVVGESLLKTLESILKEHFSQEVREAWTEAYRTLAKLIMGDLYEEKDPELMLDIVKLTAFSILMLVIIYYWATSNCRGKSFDEIIFSFTEPTYQP